MTKLIWSWIQPIFKPTWTRQVLPDDTTPIANNTVTASNTKEFSNINTNEPITVDKAISLKDEVQSMDFTVTTPVKEMTWTLKTAKTMI